MSNQHDNTPRHEAPQGHAMGAPQKQYSHPEQQPTHHVAQAQHHWQNGNHYTGSRHVVNRGDWDRYHLRQPPNGYEWVQDGNQFVLITISTGIIASVLAANGY